MVSLIRYLVPSGKEDGTARELREDDEDDDPVHVFGQVVDAVIRNGCVEARVMPGINSSPLDRWRQMKSSRQMQRVADEAAQACAQTAAQTVALAEAVRGLSLAVAHDEDVFGQVVGQVVDAVIRNGCVEAWVMRSSPLDRLQQKKSSRQMTRAKAAGWPTEELLKVGCIYQALAMRLDAANSKVTDSGPEERHSPQAGDLDLDLDLGFPDTPNKTPREPRSDVLKWLEREELMNELMNDEDWAQTPGKTPGSSPRGERPPRKTDFLSPPGSERVSLAQAPGTRSTGSATDTLTTAPAPPLRLGDALEQLQLQMAMTATKAVGPYAAAPDADERVAAAPADEVRLPERFEELQLFSSTADASLLSAPEDASLLSAPEDAGLYSKLESGGAFNIAEKVLPLANDLKRLSTARYFFSLRARIVPHVTL
jgi:hypothetical protein